MDDKIRRDLVIDMLDEIKYEITEGKGFQYDKWRDYINHIKVETGEWIYDENGMGTNLPAWVCSNCRQKNDMIPTLIQYPTCTKKVVNPYMWAGSNYCPNCGKKMG